MRASELQLTGESDEPGLHSGAPTFRGLELRAFE